MDIEKSLQRAEVFLGLDNSDLGEIASLPSCQEETYQPDDVIFRAGEEAKFLYVLREGEVNLVIDVPSGSQEQPPVRLITGRITTGGFFGWSALVKPHFYTISAVCARPARVVKISGTELMTLFEKNQHTGYRVFQSLAHIIGTRLRYMEQVLATGRRWPFIKR